jgi:hypothetical protein
MIAVPWAGMLTVVDEPPREGTVRGVPSSAVKFTVNDTAALVVLVK